MTSTRPPLFVSLSALLLVGCTHAPLNQPIAADTPPIDYRFQSQHPPKGRDDLLLTVYFSGGGTRAAAFSCAEES